MIRYLEAKPPSTVRARGVLLLLHAFPLNARMWEPQLALAAHGWRVIAPHMRGVDGGDTDPPTSTMDDYAGDVIDLLDRLHVEEAVVGGCSMGGYLAFALLRLAERYVRGLILADTRAAADTPEAIEGRKKMLTLVSDKGTSAVVEQMVPKLLGETTRKTHPEIVERVRSIALSNSPESVAGMVRALMTRQDATPLLSKIHVPTLILVGAEDTLTPPAMSEQMHAAIAGSEMVVLPNIGHLSSVENPTTFNDAAAKFLEHRL
jgi:3-oxoadipate enol-lactonase